MAKTYAPNKVFTGFQYKVLILKTPLQMIVNDNTSKIDHHRYRNIRMVLIDLKISCWKNLKKLQHSKKSCDVLKERNLLNHLETLEINK